MMKSIFAATLTLMLSVLTLNAQETPESILESFFATVAQEKVEEAIQNLPLSNQLKNDTSVVAGVLKQLENSTNNAGTYCGYEQINKEEISASYLACAYFIKYSDIPVRMQFIFYKPKETWQVNQIKIMNTGTAHRNRTPVRPRMTR